MAEWLHTFKDFINPEYIVRTGGVLILLLIIFAETGLFFGFFFPGDSLLFVAGLAVKNGWLPIDVFSLIIFTWLAAIVGNFAGYAFGYVLGPRLFRKEESFFFKKKHLAMTQSFYDKYGKAALILGRFLPIVRTFVPILAGAIRMNLSRFAIYNVIGATLWVPTLIILGYLLGSIDWVKQNLELIVIGLVIVTILPVIRTYFRERKKFDRKTLENTTITNNEQKTLE